MGGRTAPSSARPLAVLGGGLALLAACTVIVDEDQPVPTQVDEQNAARARPRDAGPLTPALVNEDSGVFGASEHPSSGGYVSARDAGPGLGEYCGATVAAGDLAVVELMIAARSGSGDPGEWVEIQSTRDCWLHLSGVVVTSPRGAAAANSVTIDDLDLAPGGTFVVADTVDPAKNHGIPGPVFAWNATDVLKNDGDTVRITAGELTVDTVTYPAFTSLPVGRALSFPVDCAWSDRSDWARWSLTFHAFAAGLAGTPNAPNTDVTCF